MLQQVQVEYKSFPGWKTKLSDIREYKDLPKEAKDYIGFIQDFIQVPVKYIGVGAGREAMIISPE